MFNTALQSIFSSPKLYFPLTQSVVRFTGLDTVKFLQGALSNDLKQLTPTTGLAACALTPKGKLLAALKLLQTPQGVLALTSSAETTALKEGLKTLLLFSETQLEDVSANYQIYLLCGQSIVDFFNQELSWHPQHPMAVREWNLEGYSVFLMQDIGWKIPVFLAWVPTHCSKNFCDLLKLRIVHLSNLEEEAFQKLRIASKLPIYGVDLDEKNLPLEAGFEEYISYSKGCYTGQETIARLKHYGRTTKLLMQFAVVGQKSIVESTVFWGEKEMGKITSAVFFSEINQTIGIGIVNRDAEQKEVVLQLAEERWPAVWIG